MSGLRSSTVAFYIISMKPLEQGGQLPRPKPPVDQRVKGMDTLDKKMQTILDREDLSSDERLKLNVCKISVFFSSE
jgi:hypothetical protein